MLRKYAQYGVCLMLVWMLYSLMLAGGRITTAIAQTSFSRGMSTAATDTNCQVYLVGTANIRIDKCRWRYGPYMTRVHDAAPFSYTLPATATVSGIVTLYVLPTSDNVEYSTVDYFPDWSIPIAQVTFLRGKFDLNGIRDWRAVLSGVGPQPVIVK